MKEFLKALSWQKCFVEGQLGPTTGPPAGRIQPAPRLVETPMCGMCSVVASWDGAQVLSCAHRPSSLYWHDPVYMRQPPHLNLILDKASQFRELHSYEYEDRFDSQCGILPLCNGSHRSCNINCAARLAVVLCILVR